MKDNKKGLHPVWFFSILIVITIGLSFILSLNNIQGTEYSISQTGKVTSKIITVNSMFGRTGLSFIFGDGINNLAKFTPFGAIIIGLIGVGALIKTGLLKEIFSRLSKKIPRRVMFFLFSLLCIVMGFSQDLSFVIMIPISIPLFTEYKRSQVTGMTLAFVSVAAGANINLFITSLDYSLIEIAKNTVKSIDSDYSYGYSGNLFFIVIASLLLALLISIITEFVSRNKPVRIAEEENEISEKVKNKALRKTSLVFIVISIIFVYSILPGLPFSGALLDNEQLLYVNKLFGANSPFVNGILYIVAFISLICGIVYGISTKQIKSEIDIVKLLTSNLNNIGELLLILFFASEFVSIFKYSNIGEVITSRLFDFIYAGEFSFIVLIAFSILAIIISGLFMSSVATKWQMFVPCLLPLFMKSNITPEFTGAIFRLASSIPNMISPVFPYFALYAGFMALYSKNDFRMRKCYGTLMPYFIGITILFIFIIFGWYILGAPIGSNIYPTI